MMRIHWAAILGMTLFVACASQPKAAQKADSATAVLTDAQIKRYVISYPAIRAMASRYWGPRHYTSPNKMLGPQGTFERAYAEMDAADAMPDFELLLQSYGYDDRVSWMRINERIAYAYGMLRLSEINPAHVKHLREERMQRRKVLDAERAKIGELPEGERAGRLEALDESERSLDRDTLAERDAEVLRPYASDIEKMNKLPPTSTK